MHSPFPGMDPHLENPNIWPDFHDHLASRLSVELNQRLPRPYYARLEMRAELGIIADRRRQQRVVPDIVVVNRPIALSKTGDASTAVLEHCREDVSDSVEIEIQTEPLRHRFVEIRDASRGHELITLIEIMSPSNKRPGPDRDAYEEKREVILQSNASLIEIDLLRGGMRAIESPNLEDLVPDLGGEPSSYFVLVNRGWRRGGRGATYQMFSIGLRDVLPCIPVPLKEGETEPVIDLQYVFNRVYDGGPYARGAVDDTAPPDPPMNPKDAIWASTLTTAWLAGVPA